MSTPAIEVLEAAGIAHAVHRFDPSLDGAATAGALGLEPGQMLKTLAVASMPRVVLVCLGLDRRLDLTALRVLLGEPRTALIQAAALERMTGFQPGAVTPIAAAGARRFPVCLDREALDLGQVGVGAGEAGVEIVLAPADLAAVTNAKVAPLSRSDGA